MAVEGRNGKGSSSSNSSSSNRRRNRTNSKSSTNTNTQHNTTPLTPENIGHAANEEVVASLLHPATVGIKVHVSHGFEGAQATHEERVSVSVDYVNETRVRVIQTHRGREGLEERPRWIET